MSYNALRQTSRVACRGKVDGLEATRTVELIDAERTGQKAAACHVNTEEVVRVYDLNSPGEELVESEVGEIRSLCLDSHSDVFRYQ